VDNFWKFVDKRICKNNFLAEVMFDHLGRLNEIYQNFSDPKVLLKSDSSPVTQLDLELSQFLEEIQKNYFPKSSFYSEEKYQELLFPGLIVDPLDGTREFIQGSDEWSISVALIENDDFKGQGWIGNLARKECFSSPPDFQFKNKPSFIGEVSRWEYESGLYSHIKFNRFLLQPKGSIAYKLARLAYGEIDFVVSLKPKNIWDIAAGVVLCKERGISFFSEGKEIKKVLPYYKPPLIWCPSELASELLKIFS
jgi:myo-inositol-1(or 4)-monophosphatase